MDQASSPFFDKRDENYYKLNSHHMFFEIFTKGKLKCDLKISQTIIF